MLLRGKSDRNVKSNGIFFTNSQYNKPPWTTNVYKGYQVSRSTHDATLQKTSWTRFSLSLHWRRGRKVESTSLLNTTSTHMSYRNKTTLLPTLKALWLPRINGMQGNRRLSSERQQHPSDSKTVSSVRLCLLSVKPVGQGVGVNDSTSFKVLFVIHSFTNNHKQYNQCYSDDENNTDTAFWGLQNRNQTAVSSEFCTNYPHFCSEIKSSSPCTKKSRTCVSLNVSFWDARPNWGPIICANYIPPSN